jgi:hypothetical protein
VGKNREDAFIRIIQMMKRRQSFTKQKKGTLVFFILKKGLLLTIFDCGNKCQFRQITQFAHL